MLPIERNNSLKLRFRVSNSNIQMEVICELVGTLFYGAMSPKTTAVSAEIVRYYLDEITTNGPKQKIRTIAPQGALKGRKAVLSQDLMA